MADSEKLQKQVIDAIGKVAPNVKCPICGQEEWIVQLGTSFLPLSVQTGSTTSYTGNALPVALLICNVCGNTHLMNQSILLKPR
jgi:hypothetical protein